MNRGSQDSQSQTSNGNTSSRRLFLQAAAVSAGATLALSPYPGLNQQAHEDRDVPAQDNEGILYREKDRDGELMKGFPPPSDKRVTLHNYASSLAHTRWAFQNPHVLFRTAEISRGTRDVRPLSRRTCDEASLDALEVPWALEYKDAQPLTVKEWLSRSQTDALIVLRDGDVLAEIYFGDMRPDTRHFCWSVGKGFLAAVVGTLMAEGKLAENDVVEHRVPELARTGLSGATVRHLLDQTAGIAFKEFPAPGDDEATIDGLTFGTAAYRTSAELYPSYHRACGILPLLESEDKSKGVYDFLFQLALRDRPHGNALWYAEPHVAALQLIVERITGRSFIEEFGDRIWSRLGAERSGLAITDRLGTATNGTGLCVTARDAARFGQMMLDMGRVEGEEVVPPGFIDDIFENPNSEIVNAESNLSGVTLPGTGYRSLFWTVPSDGRLPLLVAVGLYSQHILVDRNRNMVVVKFSTHSALSVTTSDVLALKSLCEKLDSL